LFGTDEGELVIGVRMFVIEVDDEDDGEGEGGGCSEVAEDVFCEVGDRMEVMDGVGWSWATIAGAKDEFGASWDGADTRDAMPAKCHSHCLPP